MPNTHKLNQHFDVTTRADGRSKGLYKATAEIFDQRGKSTGKIAFGEGETLPRAEADAIKRAKQICPKLSSKRSSRLQP